jgi:hypothetical protein
VAKLQQNNKQFTLTLDKDKVEVLNWKKGDNIICSLDQYRKDMILFKK